MPSCTDAKGVVFNIMRFAVHDGPGIRTAVFFKGCPLDCWWCHNPESQRYRPEPLYFEERCRDCGGCVEVCPEEAIRAVDGAVATDLARCLRCGTCVEACDAAAREICGRAVGVEELIAEVERDVVFFDDSGGGVTLSVALLAQPSFAVAFLQACRERRIHTALETCGFAHPLVFQMVTENADLVLFDLKTLDRGKHRRYTGVFNDRILANLETIAAAGRPLVVRIPMVPGVNDSDVDAQSMAAHLARSGVRRVDLLPYHRMGAEKQKRLGLHWRMEEVQPPAAEHMEQLAQPFREAGLITRVGG